MSRSIRLEIAILSLAIPIDIFYAYRICRTYLEYRVMTPDEYSYREKYGTSTFLDLNFFFKNICLTKEEMKKSERELGKFFADKRGEKFLPHPVSACDILKEMLSDSPEFHSQTSGGGTGFGVTGKGDIVTTFGSTGFGVTGKGDIVTTFGSTGFGVTGKGDVVTLFGSSSKTTTFDHYDFNKLLRAKFACDCGLFKSTRDYRTYVPEKTALDEQEQEWYEDMIRFENNERRKAKP